MDTSKVKNIIFDLGGVLLNINYNNTVESFRKLGLKEPEKAFTKEVQSGLFRELEKGMISEEEFVERISPHMKGASYEEIIKAWNAILEDFPADRIDFLTSLSRDYNLYLLSNTNEIHAKAFEQIIEESVGWKAFSQCFKGIGYSHDLKARKPDAEIFEKLLSKYILKADESIFIDDTIDHILGARKMGITSIHLQDGMKTEKVISDFLGKDFTSF